NMPVLSACGATGVINGKLYVATPCDGFSGYRNFLHEWDPATNSWTAKANSSSAHSNPAFGVINGKLYVAGGANNAGYSNMLEAYDPVSNTWATLAPMPTARAQASGAVIGGRLVVAGGYAGGAYTGVVEIYDPQSNSWTTDTPMTTIRQQAASGSINNIGYFAGGYLSAGTITNVVEALNLSTSFSLTITHQGPNTGATGVTPLGYLCNSATPGSCVFSIPFGTSLTL